MSKKIKKIQNLKNIESFLQINLFKGYRYVDKAGEIVNNFYQDKKEPLFKMDLNGLIIFQPEKKVEEIKISSRVFWSRFINPDSLDSILNYFLKKSIVILDILNVDRISRLGWRNYFVLDFPDKKKRDEIFDNFFESENLKMEELSFSTKNNDIELNIRIMKVKNNETGIYGILFDADIFQLFNDLLEKEELSKRLNNFVEFIKSSDFKNILNEIIENKKYVRKS